MLFAINDATTSNEGHDSAWVDLFVEALTAHVLADSTTPGVVDADEAAYLMAAINGDGVVDGWAPECADQYAFLEFSIFDRYGRKVVTLRQGQKWDGMYNEKELPTGDYWYVVNLNDPSDDRDFVGHFILYR